MKKTLLGAALASVSFSPFATAQYALEEVIVSAQKREETIQETPISMAAFNAESLAKMGVTDAMDIDSSVPNVMLTPHPASRNSATAYIRGVGNPDLQVTKDPAVGVYVDGVYLGRASGLSADLADLERVEVLRGPQGTLYGRNTSGGALNLITAKPEQRLAFKQKVSVGNRDYWRSQTMLNLPITEQLAARMAYMASQKNGWVKNDGPGHDWNEDDKEAGRVALQWTPTDRFTVDYAYDRSRADGGPQAYQITSAPAFSAGAANPYAEYARKHRMGTLSVADLRNGVEDTVSGHALTLTWDLDNVTFKSISAYREVEAYSFTDYSGSVHTLAGSVSPAAQAVAVGLLPGGAEILSYDQLTEQDQFSQEFQAVGDALDGRLEYVAGVFYFHEQGRDQQPDTRNNLVALGAAGALMGGDVATYSYLNGFARSSFDVKAKAESVAAYGQLAFTPDILEDRLKFTVGMRFTKDEREAAKRSVSRDIGLLSGTPGAVVDGWYQKGDTESSKFTPSLIVDFAATDSIKLYAKYSEAYRAGGFNVRATREAFGNGFAPEELTAYEIGVKSDLLDNRLRINAAAFYYDYQDLQVDQSVAGDIAASITSNAGKASVDGFELDVTALLMEGLQLTASYGYLNTEYKEFMDLNPLTGQIEDLADQRVEPSSPQNSYTVALDYTFPSFGVGELSAHLQYHWEDKSYFAPGMPLAYRKPVGMLDASLLLAAVPAGAGQLSVQVWGKNLENKEYAVHAFDYGSFIMSSFNEPRSYGLDVTYEY